MNLVLQTKIKALVLLLLKINSNKTTNFNNKIKTIISNQNIQANKEETKTLSPDGKAIINTKIIINQEDMEIIPKSKKYLWINKMIIATAISSNSNTLGGKCINQNLSKI